MKQFRLLFFILLILSSACHHQQSADIKPHIIDKTLLEEGDLIVRRGTALSSRAVQHSDGEAGYSHIGILVLRDSCWYVVHCVPGEEEESGGKEYIKCDSLALFVREDRAEIGAVYRYDTCVDIRQQIAVSARKLAQQDILFDREYNDADSSKMYCTEMVDFLYHQVSIELTEGRRHNVPGFRYPLIYPSDILKNKKLYLILSF